MVSAGKACLRPGRAVAIRKGARGWLNALPFILPGLILVPLLLQRLNGQYATRWEWVFAASLLALIPVVLLFVLFQRKMVVGGLTQGAVKG